MRTEKATWPSVPSEKATSVPSEKATSVPSEKATSVPSEKATSVPSGLDPLDPREFKSDPHDLSPVELVELGVRIFQEAGCIQAFSVDETKIRNFLTAIIPMHKSNPYHNVHHAFHVLLNTFRFATSLLSRVPALEIFALLVAAISHDLCHLGVNNGHLVTTQHPIAVKYGGVSPLENNSISEAFALLEKKELAIFETLTEAQRKDAKDMIRTLIIATDLGNSEASKTMLDEWNCYCADKKKFQMTERSHRLAFLRCVLLCADVGIVSEAVPVYVPWLKRLYSEGLLLNSTDYESYHAGQGKFFEIYAKPMFERVERSGVMPEFTRYCDQLRRNQQWLTGKDVAIAAIEAGKAS